MPGTGAKLWIGTSGWSYPDWRGVVYPRRAGRGFHPLRYLAGFCNAVEVNASFYALPDPRHTSQWAELVPEDFRFSFKLTRTFTHDPAGGSRAELDAFCAALEPLRAAGRLGPVLAQFPWSFRYNRRNAERLARLADALADQRLVIEVRHASWDCPAGRDLLARLGTWCRIDQPPLRDCLGPDVDAPGPLAYVRLHGRNAANWFAENIEPWQRYDYLYSRSELREWVERLTRICAAAREVYVLANNHYRGQGLVNALELKALLHGGRVAVPPPLVASYPRLADIAAPSGQMELFD